MNIAIVNGPNLNLLGKRETDIYGSQPFETYLESLKAKYPHIHIHYFQSNIEGEIISELQRIGFDYDGIIINPGGYTHTSVAIGDAIAAIKTPVVEVHISNVATPTAASITITGSPMKVITFLATPSSV